MVGAAEDDDDDDAKLIKRLKRAMMEVAAAARRDDMEGVINAIDVERMMGEIDEDRDRATLEEVGAAYDMGMDFFQICKKHGLDRSAYIAFIEDKENPGHSRVVIGGEQTIGGMLATFVAMTQVPVPESERKSKNTGRESLS